VVEDLGSLREDRPERVLLDAEEVRREDLDRRLGQLRLQGADRRRVVPGAAIWDVVAVDGGDDDVLELHLRRRVGEAQRLERIRRMLRFPGMDVAVAAGPGARIAEDLERRGPAPPALRDVGAAGLLADRVQARAVDQLLDVEVTRVRARRADLHPLRPARPFSHGKRLLHVF
jgi:hypothetical protein